MENEKLKSLSDQQLIRRKRFVLFITGLSIGLFVLCLILLIFKLVSGETSKIGGLVPGLILPFIVLPMYMGVKKINLELKSRKTENQ
jgi:hypothetical protein